MRVCAVTHYCKPHIGGIEAISFEQARLLAERGHHTTIVSSRTLNEMYEESLNGVRILRVKALNFLEEWLGIPYPLFSLSLLRVLNTEVAASDVCIIHGFAFFSSLIACYICLKQRKPYIVYQYNTFVQYRNPLLNIIQKINDHFVGKFVIRFADEVLAVNEETKQYIHEIKARRVDILHEMVNDRAFRRCNSKEAVRQSLGIPQDAFVILTVGRLVFKRAIDTFVEVARLLLNRSDICFVIVGDGPERGKIEEYVRTHQLSNCTLTGACPHEAMPCYYAAADLFVLSSRTGEGLPIALLEAWASELPVIATRAGAMTETFHPDDNGFIVDADAPEQIAQIITAYYDKHELLERFGKRGRETISQYFTDDAHINRLQFFLEKAIG